MTFEEKIKAQRKKARYNAKFKEKHWITKVYGRMKSSSKSRKNCGLHFTKDEFANWVYEQDSFKELFDNWVCSDFDKNKVPSIDRIDDYLGYSFDNIRLTTWDENNKNGRISKKNKLQCSDMAKKKWSKKVYMINKENNEVLKEYYSAREAARDNNFDASAIAKVCRGEKNSHKGYIWRYADE